MKIDKLRIEANITKYYHEGHNEHFFKDFHFEITNNDIFCLLGISGVGKTTLINIITNFANGKFEGKIDYFINGISYNAHYLKKLGAIGYLSSQPALIPWNSIQQNLLLPLNLNPKLVKPAVDEIEKILSDMGLSYEKIKSLYPHEMSLGMRHRISLARVLLYYPKFLFLDELFTGLDPINVEIITVKIKKYLKDNNVLCLLVTHDFRQALMLSNNIYFLSNNQTLINLNAKLDEDKIKQILKEDLLKN